MGPRKCEAFTKSCTPCRGYANHQTGLCARHKNWCIEFKGLDIFIRLARWDASSQTLQRLKRLLSSPVMNFSWTVMAKEMNAAWSAENTRWTVRRTAEIIYDLLCETGRIEPPSCIALWNNKVELYCQIISDMIITGGDIEKIKKEAKRLFFDPYMSNAPSTIILCSYMAIMPCLAITVPHSSLLKITDMLIEHVDGTQLAFYSRNRIMCFIGSGQHITNGLFQPSPEIKAFLTEVNEFFETRLTERVLAVRASMKLRCDTFKEELMMNRWHPDRVFQHLDMGLELEEM